MRRLQIQRELQIDQRQIFAAAASDRGAETIEGFGAASLRRIGERRKLVAGAHLLRLFHDHRMVRHRLFEFAVDFQRLVLGAGARQVAAIGLHGAHRHGVGLVGALVALAGILFVVGDIEDQAGMQILEDGVPIRTGEPVEGVDRGVRVAGAGERPGRQQRRRQIGDRAAHRLGEILPRQRVLLLLEGSHADHQPRDAIVAVDLDHTVGKPAGFVDIAFGQDREKGAAEQVGVARIGLQHVEVIGSRGGRVALGAGMPGGQIAAGSGRMHKVLCRRRLRGERGLQAEDDGSASDGGVPEQQRVSHDISIGELKSADGESAPVPLLCARMTLLP